MLPKTSPSMEYIVKRTETKQPFVLASYSPVVLLYSKRKNMYEYMFFYLFFMFVCLLWIRFVRFRSFIRERIHIQNCTIDTSIWCCNPVGTLTEIVNTCIKLRHMLDLHRLVASGHGFKCFHVDEIALWIKMMIGVNTLTSVKLLFGKVILLDSPFFSRFCSKPLQLSHSLSYILHVTIHSWHYALVPLFYQSAIFNL